MDDFEDTIISAWSGRHLTLTRSNSQKVTLTNRPRVGESEIAWAPARSNTSLSPGP